MNSIYISAALADAAAPIGRALESYLDWLAAQVGSRHSTSSIDHRASFGGSASTPSDRAALPMR